MKNNAAADCYVDVSDRILSIGNSQIERKWTLDSTGIFPLSLLDKRKNTEWLDPKTVGAARAYSHPATAEFSGFTVYNELIGEDGRTPKHMLVSVSAQSDWGEVKWNIRIYPNSPLVRQTVLYRASGRTSANEPATAPEKPTQPKAKTPTDYIDYIPLAPLHCRWQSITFRDVTDSYNNLVSKDEGLFYTDSEKRSLSGNFMTVRNNLTKEGLLLVKESPTPFGQLEYHSGDYYISGKRVWITGSGVSERDLTHGGWVECYGSAVGVYCGDELEQLQLIRRYYDCLQIGHADRDSYIMSNTWGDRSRDGRVTESFILQELEQAARLGITHVQIDDGWQKGVTSNSVIPGGTWADYYSKHADFWDVHPERFPNGFAPIVERAKQLNIQLGLWFSPDSTDDFAHWEKDLQTLIRLWDEYGVRYFKLDGISIRSKVGEANFLNMLNEMIKHAAGDVYFNLDTTAGKRQGYLYHTSVGCLFLENRYTDFRNYYPHWTLRNIWMLASYVPAAKLQMEFLNNERNTQLYNDPLSPESCGIAYSFAVTMLANPLAWMELSSLSERQTAELTPLIELYNRIKPETSRGHVLPIGTKPNGAGWTGLQCMLSATEGYLLVFREYTDELTGSFELWGDRGASVKLTCLARSCGRERVDFPNDSKQLSPSSSGAIGITLEQPLSFALYRYTIG